MDADSRNSLDKGGFMPSIEADFAGAIQAAWAGQMDHNLLLNSAEQLAASGGHTLSIVLYQTWLKRNQTPFNHVAWFNLGAALFQARDVPGAE